MYVFPYAKKLDLVFELCWQIFRQTGPTRRTAAQCLYSVAFHSRIVFERPQHYTAACSVVADHLSITVRREFSAFSNGTTSEFDDLFPHLTSSREAVNTNVYVID